MITPYQFLEMQKRRTEQSVVDAWVDQQNLGIKEHFLNGQS